MDYAMRYSRSHDAVIRVYDSAGNVIGTHEHAGEPSTYARFGSTLTITGERDVARWLSITQPKKGTPNEKAKEKKR
jgi:hypothetical protein